MPSLADASLTDEERRLLRRFVVLLSERFGADLRGVWLYGSRARGERPHPDSDVDLLVVTRAGRSRDFWPVWSTLQAAATEESANPGAISVQVFDPQWLDDRRAIRSFYMQEVDRDKIVLTGDP